MNPEDVKPGTCFMYKAAHSRLDHMHIVLAINCQGLDADECVIVNLTESAEGDESLTFVVGDHPYITKKSDVNFGDAEISTKQKVATLASRCEPLLIDFDAKKLHQIGVKCKTHPAVMIKIRKALAVKFLVSP
jgi:hypothetical protein